MREILPGLHHWTAFHEGIRSDVSSHYAAGSRALIDPMLPPDGLDAFDELPRPEVIVLTNRHHYRNSDRFAERFGCPVRCHESGLHEFEGSERKVEGFSFGEQLAPGIVTLEVDAICPDDTALHLDVGDGVLAFADALVHWGDGRVGFVPDQYMDGPEQVKKGIRDVAARLLEEQRFSTLLFAHGDPIVGEGERALREFVGNA